MRRLRREEGGKREREKKKKREGKGGRGITTGCESEHCATNASSNVHHPVESSPGDWNLKKNVYNFFPFLHRFQDPMIKRRREKKLIHQLESKP